jgi:hypothetical protein
MAEDEQLRLLREIARWTREAALPATRERVLEILDAPEKLRVYEAMSGGNESIRGLERITGVGRMTIGTWIKDWVGKGILDADTPQPKATFSLSELGIAVPRAAGPKRGDAT